MKLIAAILLTAIISFVACLFLPWWIIAVAAFLVALLIPQQTGRAFISGFLGIFLLWILVAMIIDIKNDHILSHKMAAVLPLGGSSFLIILFSGLIGALVAGMAALSGNYLTRYKGQVTRYK